MQERIAAIDGFDLRQAPYAVGGREYAPDLSPAKLTESGAAAQAAGSHPHESHYDDAPWMLHILVSNPSDSLIDGLVTRFKHGAVLTWKESVATLNATIVSAGLDAVRYIKDNIAVVTLSGTRKPAWVGLSDVTATGTITPWGHFDVGAPAGELSAPCSLKLTGLSSFEGAIAAGVKPSPLTGYTPVKSAIASANVSAAWQSLASAYSLEYPQLTGRHLAVGSITPYMWYRLLNDLAGATKPILADSNGGIAFLGELGLPGRSTVPGVGTVLESGMSLAVQAKSSGIVPGWTMNLSAGDDRLYGTGAFSGIPARIPIGSALTLSGVSGGAPLANGTTYYVVAVGTLGIGISTSLGGSVINITTPGSATIATLSIPTTCYVLGLVPSGQGAFMTQRTTVASGGLLYAHGRVHRIGTDGKTVEEVPTRLFGTDFALAPKVVNRVVVFGGPSAYSLGYELKYRPRYLSRF